MNKHALILFVFSFLFISNEFAQAPSNDNCDNAIIVNIPNNGYGLGKFISNSSNVTYSTREQAEHCIKELEESGNCTKTVWYKFYIASTRDLSVKLTQKDSAIPQIFAGFNIYKIPDCAYTLSDLSKELVPLNKFGISGNTCLSEGWYLVQVGCKKKASGEIWIELDVNQPRSEPNDMVDYMYDFLLPDNGGNSKRFNFQCASLEPYERDAILDSSFNASLWFTVTFDRNSSYNGLFIEANSLNYNSKLKYRIFKEGFTKDSIKSETKFIDILGDTYIFNENCPLVSADDRKIVIQLISKDYNGSITLSAYQNKFREDKWNTTLTDNEYELGYVYQGSRTRIVNCNSLLSTHSCKNVIPEYFIHNYKGYQNHQQIQKSDTFRYGTYTILNVKENGRLEVQTYNSNYSNNNGANGSIYYALYLGDIRNSCNLQFIFDTISYQNWSSNYFKYCVSGGNTYTLVSGFKNIEYPDKRQSIELVKDNLTKKFYYPKSAELLNPFNPSTDNGFSSQKTHFRNKDTTVIIDTVSVKGIMSFHEIYISETSNLDIVGAYCNLYLFGGQISNGSIFTLPNLSYSKPESAFGFYSSGSGRNYGKCFSLPVGYYTLICIKQDNTHKVIDDCRASEHWINIMPGFKCPINNNIEPSLAFPINLNQDVLSAQDKLQGSHYVYYLNYCKDCKQKSNIKPKLSCKTLQYLKPTTSFHYFTFFLDENASFYGPTIFELFEGNAILNPLLVQDSSKIISPCMEGNVICNLQGKRFYTLLVLMNSEYSSNGTISFVKHKKSPNDYAKSAYDLGHFSNSDNRTTPFLPITCHTGAFKSDPVYYYSGSQGKNNFVPYKDTLNKRKSYKTGNIWYTFTVSGNSTVTIRTKTNTGNSYSSTFSIFRYKGKYYQNYKQTLQNQFDSTNKSMEPIATQYAGSGPETQFHNESCSENRYFVVFNSSSSLEIELNVKVEFDNVIPEGDHCSNAVTGKYSSYGVYDLITNNSCHTYGGSTNEYGTSTTLKSTWFKIKVENLKRFDLEIRANMPQGLQGFNVYGGTCGAMTLVSRSTNAYSYFTLTCLGTGEYYIQALCYEYFDGDCSFKITISDPKNTVCKPYDFKYPIALFSYKGGCNKQDTIHIKNLSTAGNDIEYNWYLNGVKFSSILEPYLLRTASNIKDTNEIKLIVFNSAVFTRDTFISIYVKDTTKYKFEIDGPLISYCYDTLRLAIKTNFNRKLNYSWRYSTSKYVFSNASSFTQNYVYDYVYVVSAESDNCEFIDTFDVNLISTLHRYRDTAFCQGLKYVVKNNTKNVMQVNNSNLQIGDSLIFKDTEKLLIRYQDSTCYYVDTMKIDVEYGPKLLSRDDALYYCNVDEVKLKYNKEALLNHIWSTGDTTESIVVNKSGTYRLNGAFSKCRSLDQIYRLTIEEIDVDRIQDSTVCLYDQFTPYNPYGSRFAIQNQIPGSSPVKVVNPFMYILKVKRDNCIVIDSGMVNIFPNETRSIDSFYCEHRLNFAYSIDGGIAQQYNWYENNSKNRILTAKNYGYYPLARIDTYGCKDTLRYNLITNCEFNVYIPDAFTPNFDEKNERFIPHISGLYKDFNMTIFNRWGEMIYDSPSREGWDGTYKGITAMSGVYTYIVTVYDKTGKMYQYRGTVLVMY